MDEPTALMQSITNAKLDQMYLLSEFGFCTHLRPPYILYAQYGAKKVAVLCSISELPENHNKR